jgi:hypothetical protein
MIVTYRKAWRKLLFTMIIAATIFIWGLSSALTENLYSNTLYPVISICLRTLSSLVPFPLGDVLYLLLIIYVLVSIYLFVKKLFRKQLNRSHRLLVPIQVLNFVLILYIAFKLLWGLNYSRPTISNSLGISNKRYNDKELVLLAKLLIQRINHLESLKKAVPDTKKDGYKVKELQAEATQAYYKLQQRQEFFSYRSPVVKPVLNSLLITKIGLEGYYNPLSGEANVNMRLPQEDLPFVTCHEIAHQLGVAREDEANLVGYMVATNSKDLNFQYSGYFAILRNVLFEVRLIAPDQYEALYKSINPGTILDYKNGIEFWRRYNNEMFGYMSATLDSFLKINNQQKGIDSYQDIVLWVYNLHEKEIRAIKEKTLQP